MEASYDELQATYDALLLGFEKQKVVLDDAVAHICDLEVENEDLKVAFHDISESNPRSPITEYVTPRIVQSPTSKQEERVMPETPLQQDRGLRPPKTHSMSTSAQQKSQSPGRRPAKDLHFPQARKDLASSTFHASEESIGRTNQSSASLNRPHSVWSDEDEDERLERQMLNSPRLSVLSESGFSSIYGSPKEDTQHTHMPEKMQLSDTLAKPSEKSPLQHSPRNEREARVNKWIEDKARPSTPPAQASMAQVNERFTSIGEVLQKVPSASHSQESEKIYREERKNMSPRRIAGNGSHATTSPTKTRNRQKRSHSSSMNRSNLGGKLPPTPDTMSTATIGANSSTQSIITEKSLVDQGRSLHKAFTSVASHNRPITSDTELSQNPTHDDGLFFDSDAVETDDELQSIEVEQSENDHWRANSSANAASPFLGGSMHTDRMIGASRKPRPSITSRTSDMMFNGEGFALVQPTRTISYPAPSSERHDRQFSPTSQRSSGVSERTAIPSPQLANRLKDLGESPRKARFEESQVHSPIKSGISKHSPDSDGLANSNSQGTPNTQRSVTSRLRLFRRSNSHNPSAVLQNTDIASPSKPKNIRSNSFVRNQERPSISGSNVQGKKKTLRPAKSAFLWLGV